MNKAPATRGQKYREAVAFAYGTIGGDGCLEVMRSVRCQGASAGLLDSKRPVEQRDAFSVPQVEAFENGVFDLDSPHDRIMSGNTSALLHIRGRFSDVYHCASEPFLDVSEGKGYFEIPVTDTKVTRRAKIRKVLPMVGHAYGLCGRPWAEEWLRLRRLHGLNAAGGPLITAIRSSGEWTTARMRSSEATLWMRIILSKMQDLRIARDPFSAPCKVEPNQKFGTHPCKITCLSWVAKAGCEEPIREMLGYHCASLCT